VRLFTWPYNPKQPFVACLDGLIADTRCNVLVIK